MKRIVDCDPSKRGLILRERYFDLMDMDEIFRDKDRLEFVDSRFDYGEERRVTIGQALGRIFTVVYTMRSNVTWLITAWPAHKKERARYAER